MVTKAKNYMRGRKMKIGKSCMSGKVLAILLVSILLLAFFITACQSPDTGTGDDKQPEVRSMHFMMGPMGGSMYPVGALLADILFEKFPTVRSNVSPGGSITNIIAVDQGSAQVGHTTSEMAASAYSGLEPFDKEHKNIRGLFSVQIMGLQFVMAADSGISTLDEVREQKYPLKLALNPPGNVSTMLAEVVLEQHGISLDDIQSWGGSIDYVSHADMGSLYRDRHIEAMVLYTSVPAPVFVESDMARPLKFIKFSDACISYLEDTYGLVQMVASKGTHSGMTEDTVVLLGTIVLVISNDLPEDLVYDMMKNWFEPDNFERLKSMSDQIKTHLATPADAVKGIPIPLHPGAEKFFKEIGAIN